MIKTYEIVLPDNISKHFIWIAEILRICNMNDSSSGALVITENWVGTNNEGTADINDIPIEWLQEIVALDTPIVPDNEVVEEQYKLVIPNMISYEQYENLGIDGLEYLYLSQGATDTKWHPDIPKEWLHKVSNKPESKPEPTISFDVYWYNDHFKRGSYYEKIDVEKGWNACKKTFGNILIEYYNEII